MLPDGSPAEPDKGWDYSPRERLSGVERGIAKKQDKLSPVFKTTFNDMLKAWPGANIAKRIPVNDIRDLQPLLAEYARIYPEHLPHGVKAVLPAAVTDDFFMATDGRGTFWFSEIEHKGFNSRIDLLEGLEAIKTGRALTKHNEYGIENLWHEINHNRQIGADALFRLDQRHPLRQLAEMLNQYVSRVSYGGFIERLGGKAMHQKWVMANGYGYFNLVNNFQILLKRANVDQSINGDLFNINFNSDLLGIASSLSLAIAKKSRYRQDDVYKLLLSIGDDVKFNALLGQMNPILN